MATLTPTLTLASTDMNGDVLNLSVTDSLSILGQVTTKQVVASTTSTIFAAAANYTKSFVYIKNISPTPAEIITIEAVAAISATLTNDPTVTIASTRNLHVGMTVSGTGVTAGQTIALITDATHFELSAAADGGSITSVLTFSADEYMKLTPGEFAFFPWIAGSATSVTQEVDLGCVSAQGTPALEVRIYQESAA